MWEWVTAPKYTYSSQTAHDICADRYGNVYTLGSNAGTFMAIYGGTVLPGGGFFLRQDKSGTIELAVPVQGRPKAIAVDDQMNVYVAVNMDSTIYIQNSTVNSLGYSDVVILKFNHKGNLEWYRHFGSAGMDVCQAIAVDVYNDLIISGYGANITFDSYSHPGGYFLAKLDKAGAVKWEKTQHSYSYTNYDSLLINVSYDDAYNLACDKSGNIYLLGNVQGSCMYCSNYFIYKCSSSGDSLFYKNHWYSDEAPNGLNVDRLGNIYVIHNTGSHYTNSRILVKYDSKMKMLWSTYLGEGYDHHELHYGTKLDNEDNPIVAGWIGPSGYSQFDSIKLGDKWYTSRGKSDILVAGIDKNNGNFAWIKTAGGAGYEYGPSSYRSGGLATDPNGNVYIAAHFNVVDPYTATIIDTCFFDEQKLYSPLEHSQVLVAKLKMNDLTFPPIQVAINENPITDVLSIVPVPCGGQFEIQTGQSNNLLYLEILNIEGRIVRSMNVLPTEKINISDLSDGLYLVKVWDGKKIMTKKMIKRT